MRSESHHGFRSCRRLAILVVAASALLPGCSCNQTRDAVTNAGPAPPEPGPSHEPGPSSEPQPQPAIAALPNLAPGDWLLADWAAKDLDHPLPATQAELEAVEYGLRVTSHERSGPVHVLFRQELVDEFEITARIVQPSVGELQEEGLPQPSRFSSLIGFRSPTGHPNIRTHLKRDRDVRETFDIVVRGSRKHLVFTVNGTRSSIMPRSQVGPGHFFLEMPKNNRAYLVSMEVRTDLEPDAALVKAAEQTFNQSAGGSGLAMPPPGIFGPGSPMPGSPMFGPGFPGVGPAGAMGGEPPPPSRLDPLVSRSGWSVPKLGLRDLDTAIAQDLRLEANGDGLTVAKTAASGGFWLVRRIEPQGDAPVSYAVSVPSMGELAAIAGPTTLLAVGLYPAEDGKPGLVVPAPPPLPNDARDFNFSVRCSGERATLDVAGAPMGGSVSAEAGLLVGLYLRGGLRFSLRDVSPAAPAAPNTVAEAGSPPDDKRPSQPAAKPNASRVWTDVTGTRQVEATFIKLAGATVHFRRNDGTEVTVPLSGLCVADQLAVQQLAAP